MPTKSSTAPKPTIAPAKPAEAPVEKPIEDNKPVETPPAEVPPAPPAETVTNKPSEAPATGATNQTAQKDSATGENSDEAPAETEDEAPIVKSNFAKVQIKDFRGSYGDAKFDDDGRCERISKDTYEALGKQFPGAEVLEFEVIE